MLADSVGQVLCVNLVISPMPPTVTAPDWSSCPHSCALQSTPQVHHLLIHRWANLHDSGICLRPTQPCKGQNQDSRPRSFRHQNACLYHSCCFLCISHLCSYVLALFPVLSLIVFGLGWRVGQREVLSLKT